MQKGLELGFGPLHRLSLNPTAIEGFFLYSTSSAFGFRPGSLHRPGATYPYIYIYIYIDIDIDIYIYIYIYVYIYMYIYIYVYIYIYIHLFLSFYIYIYIHTIWERGL